MMMEVGGVLFFLVARAVCACIYLMVLLLLEERPRWMHQRYSHSGGYDRRTNHHIDHLHERQKNCQFSVKQIVSLSATHAEKPRPRSRPTSCIASRSAKGFKKAIWAKVRRMRTVNLLPAVLLLQLLLSRRLAGRFWVKCYPGRYPRASLSNVTLDAHVICRPGIALLTGKGRRT